VTGRDRIVLVVVGVVAAIAASWLLVISPKRDQASKLQTQIHGVQTSLSAARSQLSQAESARSVFRSSYATMVKLGEAVPTDDNVPSLIYQIQSAASAARVDFLGLTLDPAGAGGAAPAPTPAAGTSSTATAGSTSTPASSAAVLPPGVGIGPAGFPIEPFTFTFQGNFFHLADFFGRLERFVVATNRRVSVSGRLLTLDAISLAPGASGFPQISASVSATTYLLPTNEGVVAGATPAGPAPAGSQPVSTSPSSTSSAAPPAAAVAPVK
jgi:type II secretory pathway pseudopilin PulG